MGREPGGSENTRLRNGQGFHKGKMLSENNYLLKQNMREKDSGRAAMDKIQIPEQIYRLHVLNVLILS